MVLTPPMQAKRWTSARGTREQNHYKLRRFTLIIYKWQAACMQDFHPMCQSVGGRLCHSRSEHATSGLESLG
jgi:hypothetical protein